MAQRISVWATRHKQALASVIAGIKNGFVIGNDLGIAFGKYVAVLRSDGLYVLRREKPSLKVCFDNNLGLRHELLGDESQQRLLVLFDRCDGLRIILLQESGVGIEKGIIQDAGKILVVKNAVLNGKDRAASAREPPGEDLPVSDNSVGQREGSMAIGAFQ